MHIGAGCPICHLRHPRKAREGREILLPASTTVIPATFARRLKIIERFTPPGALLEISDEQARIAGCAVTKGWRVASARASLGKGPLLIREGLWQAGSFDAVLLCGSFVNAYDHDYLLRMAAHYSRLDGVLLVEATEYSGKFDATTGISSLLQRHGFRLTWHCRLPGTDDNLLLSAVARYVP